MPKFIVTLPINGCVTASVEAEDAESAIQKAFENGEYELSEWDAYTNLHDGNIFNGQFDEAEAELQEEK